jgi:hypothetical protein
MCPLAYPAVLIEKGRRIKAQTILKAKDIIGKESQFNLVTTEQIAAYPRMAAKVKGTVTDHLPVMIRLDRDIVHDQEPQKKAGMTNDITPA